MARHTRSLLLIFGTCITLVSTTDAIARGRMYNPELGRFMQRDPLGTAIQAPAIVSRNHSSITYTERDRSPSIQYGDGMNLYQYQKSAPIVYLDPTGYKSWKTQNGDPLNIAFLGLNPTGQGFDGRGYINWFADFTFTSTDRTGAKRKIDEYFDLDQDGDLDAADCPPFKLGISGYSWGGWTALQLAHGLSDDFEIHMGLVDPVNTARSRQEHETIRVGAPHRRGTGGVRSEPVGPRFGTKPNNVVKSVNFYQTLGCTDCPISSSWYRSQAITGFDINFDYSAFLVEKDAHIQIAVKSGKNASLTAHRTW